VSQRKVHVYASPGWEVDVDPEWAEGLFAVFLRNAKKKGSKPKARAATRRKDDDTDVILLKVEEAAVRPTDDTVQMPVPPKRGDTTARRTVASLRPQPEEMSGAGLDEFLHEMVTLVKYGHGEQVAGEVRRVFKLYPQDLLLRRRVIDFLVGSKLVPLATEELYGLGAALFERGDVDGVRSIVSQVLALDPDSPRARRLMKLLSDRPRTSPGRR